MRTEEASLTLRHLLHQRPFEPFLICLDNGKEPHL